jgi:hypothetical protein
MDTVQVTVHTESEAEQFDALHRAFEIFRERSATRGDLWAEFGADDALDWMQKKVLRVAHAKKMMKGCCETMDIEVELVDDALDLINYTVFLIRHIEGSVPDVKAQR